MTQEALKLALEALEKNTKHLPADFDYHFEAITAIKEALAQTERHELQAKGEHPAPCARHCEAPAFGIVIKNLKAQLAQPKQVGINGLTEAETNATASVMGLVNTTPPQRTEQPAQRKPLTEEEICLIAHNIDSNDWNDLNFKECWHKGFKAGFREAEIEHNIKGVDHE